MPELLDPNLQDLTIVGGEGANLADNARVTVTWQRGQKALDPGVLGDLSTGVEKALAAGVDVYLDVYPNGSSQTPTSPADQGAFATWTASVVAGLPGIRHVIVGNEPNLNLFWLPQFGSSRQRPAAIGYERLLARTYDAVKAAAPTVEVVGGALAHSGTDKPGTGRDTHSPAQFILDMGSAYRASHRTKPIMDAFAYHPYMERSDLPPTFRHVRWEDADDRRLRKARLGAEACVRGHGPEGRDAADRLRRVRGRGEDPGPSTRRSTAAGEPPTTRPVSEATQATYYVQAMHLAACQPTVRAFMVFRLIDSEFLESFQSGVYYADRQTPKSSLPVVAASARKYRARAIAGCATLLAPKPLVDWGKRQIICDERLPVRRDVAAPRLEPPGRKPPGDGARRRDHPARPCAAPGRPIPLALRVAATAYKANAYVKTFG